MSPPPQNNTHILLSFSVSAGEQNAGRLCPKRKHCTDWIICLLLHTGSSKTLTMYFTLSLWGKRLISHQHSSDWKILDVQGNHHAGGCVSMRHTEQERSSTNHEVLLLMPKWNKMFSLQVWVVNSHRIVSHKPLKPAQHCLGLICYTQTGIWIPDSHFSSIQQTRIFEAAGAEYSLRLTGTLLN